MTTIEKHQFKVTIPTIIAIILGTISTLMSLMSFKEQANSSLNDIRSQMELIKSAQEIQQIKNNNQMMNLSNARKRDSAFVVNSFNDIKALLDKRNEK